jgi:hypothetical protein
MPLSRVLMGRVAILYVRIEEQSAPESLRHSTQLSLRGGMIPVYPERSHGPIEDL